MWQRRESEAMPLLIRQHVAIGPLSGIGSGDGISHDLLITINDYLAKYRLHP